VPARARAACRRLVVDGHPSLHVRLKAVALRKADAPLEERAKGRERGDGDGCVHRFADFAFLHPLTLAPSGACGRAAATRAADARAGRALRAVGYQVVRRLALVAELAPLRAPAARRATAVATVVGDAAGVARRARA
jgi:hypothetical protein